MIGLVAFAAFAIAQQQAAPPAPPPAPPPSVSMDVARARVAKVKTLLAVAANGNGAALTPIVAPGATTDINGIMGLLKPDTIAPLKGCTRVKPFEVNEDAVVLTMRCTGGLPADTTTEIDFDGELIAKVSAAQTVYRPATPPAPPAAPTEPR
ncbi:hypothetical protein LZK98_12545 [Sphingomonas cannabina]|uniref:hypothetical protein n=1 Tax=Sphingomonas cannabina TaxID=2899123 RepID=UPI001F2663A1|nr:hypothetical protein [Sphingomonas cannabina]UIJ43919.1 hypothetical protein LZK98_12545 [Sphingomonas cannabina]